MQSSIKDIKIGNSLGIVLPKEAIQAQRLKEGSALYLTEAPESSLRITAERKGFRERKRNTPSGCRIPANGRIRLPEDHR
jgi:antitoxin component of MazEF toxin-antitoxin module